MAFVLDLLRQAGDVLITAELAVVVVSAILGALAMFFVMCYIFEVVACWRVFKKAGQGGWKSLIPVYSNYTRYRISWRPLWFWVSALLLIASTALGHFSGQNAVADGASIVVGVAGFLVHMAGRWNLARAFGRGPLFSLGMILFPPLFTLILGLGGSEYQGPRAAQRG